MRHRVVFVIMLLIFLLVSTGCGMSAIVKQLPGSITTPPATATPTLLVAPASGSALVALEETLQNIYTQVNPSVVNIRVVQKRKVSMPTIPRIPDMPGLPSLPFEWPDSQAQEFYQDGQGSGFVWDKAGHIVTNNHVVEGADKISVTFHDGLTVPGEVIAADPDSDLAVVKVDLPADQLRPVHVADSTQARVGELVVAIGNPFGLEGTMTVGFISALGRSLPVQSGDVQGARYVIPDVIQTDAPINPGNSGGALVDDQGRLVGVPTAIESPVQASAGVGFAVPSAIVQKVVPVLIESGHYEHAWIGISGVSLGFELVEAMKLESTQRGVLVVEVVPGSPAEKAGLRGSDRQVTIEGEELRVGGDVIVAIDGQPVKEFDDVVTYLARFTEVGQIITLTLLRDGRQESVDLTLAARPTSADRPSPAEGGQASGAWLGIQGLALTPEIAEAMELASDQQGVLVVQVEQEGPADKAGLRGSYKTLALKGQRLLVGGDVITALDNQAVKDMGDLQSLLRQAEPGQRVTLALLRDGKRIEVTVTLAERPAN